MDRGIHGEKIVAAIENEKTSINDKERLRKALNKYDVWISALNAVDGYSVEHIIEKMVKLLGDYKYYIDIDLIFDSPEDFLYRQKGQLKLDNTIMEEFVPILAEKCMKKHFGEIDVKIGSQIPTYSSTYFETSLSVPGIGGGMKIRVKDQDFSMSRTLYLKASYNADFKEEETAIETTHLGYILAEMKTNLDKTMFQEASATAHDVKQAVTGAKYYLLCDFLDMTPISTTTTDIDAVLITRKAKRIGSSIRKKFSKYAGRQELHDWYVDYLETHPYSEDIFIRFINNIISQMTEDVLVESDVLDLGYF